MINKETTIQNKTGFHVRPTQLFIEKANEYKSKIIVKNDSGMETDGKSILGLMTLGLDFGSKIIVQAEGEDEETAVNELISLINSKFGEE